MDDMEMQYLWNCLTRRDLINSLERIKAMLAKEEAHAETLKKNLTQEEIAVIEEKAELR